MHSMGHEHHSPWNKTHFDNAGKRNSLEELLMQLIWTASFQGQLSSALILIKSSKPHLTKPLTTAGHHSTRIKSLQQSTHCVRVTMPKLVLHTGPAKQQCQHSTYWTLHRGLVCCPDAPLQRTQWEKSWSVSRRVLLSELLGRKWPFWCINTQRQLFIFGVHNQRWVHSWIHQNDFGFC